ncbi:MAG: aldo/keto reductase [Clostridia bacterium]
MKTVRLGRTEIITNKNAFGALPIQRISHEEAGKLLVKAYENGINFFDTAISYSDSEEKMGLVLPKFRDKIFIATKTPSKTVEGFWKDLETSLNSLQTDYIDIYQFHNPSFCPKPGDGTGLYEAMLEAKAQGKIRFIGITNHRLAVAIEAVESGLYDTLQFPFSYLASQKDIDLVNLCKEKDVGFICMKALSGGLITKADAAYAYLAKFDNALPIWGVQRESELDDFINFTKKPPTMTDELAKFIKNEQKELMGDFCRGCGYCMPTCPAKIDIATCARMTLLLQRAPTAGSISADGQAKMAKIDDCINCGICSTKCPYDLNTPTLLRKNYEEYKAFLKQG